MLKMVKTKTEGGCITVTDNILPTEMKERGYNVALALKISCINTLTINTYRPLHALLSNC